MAVIKFITLLGLVLALFCLAMANTEPLESADINNAEEYMEQLSRLLDSTPKRLDIPKIRRGGDAAMTRARVAGLWPWLARHDKRNAELINSLLGLPRMLKVVG